MVGGPVKLSSIVFCKVFQRAEQGRGVGRIAQGLGIVLQGISDGLQARAAVGLLPGQLLIGYGIAVIPVRVKHVGGLRDDGPHRQRIQITEVVFGVGRKILGGDVTTADNRYLVIHGQGFVVHPSVDAPEVPGIESAETAVGKRVKQAQFDIRVVGQARQFVFHADGGDVVDQQAHTNAAVSRAQ